jgi:hypothetical protein
MQPFVQSAAGGDITWILVLARCAPLGAITAATFLIAIPATLHSDWSITLAAIVHKVVTSASTQHIVRLVLQVTFWITMPVPSAMRRA